jgi:hypothetical protein
MSDVAFAFELTPGMERILLEALRVYNSDMDDDFAAFGKHPHGSHSTSFFMDGSAGAHDDLVRLGDAGMMKSEPGTPEWYWHITEEGRQLALSLQVNPAEKDRREPVLYKAFDAWKGSLEAGDDREGARPAEWYINALPNFDLVAEELIAMTGEKLLIHSADGYRIASMGLMMYMNMVRAAEHEERRSLIEQGVQMYATAVAADILRYAPDLAQSYNNNTDEKAWVSFGLAQMNRAVRRSEDQSSHSQSIVERIRRLVGYAAGQVELVAESGLTHAEKRGALKLLAIDLRRRDNDAVYGMTGPGDIQMGDIPF